MNNNELDSKNLADARTCTREHIQQRTLNILIACEESQAECIAFRELGHNAFSCDIQECRKGAHPEWHIHSNVTRFLQGQTFFVTQDGVEHDVGKWDLIIAHPPCTYLCRSSSIKMAENADYAILHNGMPKIVNRKRFAQMKVARDFFFKCLKAKATYVAVENPIPMSIAQLPKPSCYADPSWFGVKYTKKTLYWLKNLPPILAEYEHPRPKCFVTSSRGKYRSRTFPELARAIARQWSEYIISDML